MDRGVYVSRHEAERTTLAEVIGRYIEEVSPLHKGHATDLFRLRAMQRSRLAEYSMAVLSPKVVAEYRDMRLREVAKATVVRELATLSAIINHARREWELNVPNPVAMVRKPSRPPGRTRVLSTLEEQALLEAARPVGRRNPWLSPAITLAVETAMRRGELLALRWPHIDLAKATALIPQTKNGHARRIPLSRRAVQVLQGLPQSIDGRVISVQAAALHKLFERACARAGVTDLHWHDLRHTAVSRLAKRLPNVVELAAVSGHRSLSMLQRYYHVEAEELARKIG